MKRTMRSARHLVIAGVFALGIVPAISFAGKSPKAPEAPPAPPPEPPTVASLAARLDGFKWGVNHAEITKAHTQASGLIDKDYDPLLAKLQPGTQMQSMEAERESKKAAFASTFVEFKDTPLGYDRTGIKGEYTYRNHESLMYVDRGGKRRYFFFIGNPPGERLWKIYDEVALKEGGPLGKSFQEAVTKIQVELQAPGRLRMPDPATGLRSPEVDWQDGSTHLRVVDHTADGTVGIVVEDRAVLSALASLRSNKEEDPMALDPSILAVTKGLGRVDPNAAKAAPSGSAAGKGAPKKK